MCSGCSQCAPSGCSQCAPMSFNEGYERNMCPMGSNPYLNRDTHPRQVFELYDLIADRHETTSLIGNPEHATTEARLKAALDHWRRTVLDDPFLDAGFRRRFHTQELANLDWFKAKVASESSNPTGLPWKVNRSEYSAVWDDAQYSTQDPLIMIAAPTPAPTPATPAASPLVTTNNCTSPNASHNAKTCKFSRGLRTYASFCFLC